MKNRVSLLFCFAPLLLSSCTTTTEIINQRLASVPEAQRAYVIGTYAVDCKPRGSECFHAFNSISTAYRHVTDKEIRGRLSWTGGSMFGTDNVPDYILPELSEKAYYFCLALPAGQYEVYTYDFYNFAGGGSGYSIREEGQFKVPFSVSAGEVVDIGKLHITTSTGKNFFGITLSVPGVLLLSKSSRAASEAALGKCPAGVRSRAIRDSALADSGYAPTPFVRSQIMQQPPQ